MEPIKEEPDAQQAQEAQELTKEDFTKKHKERAFTISFLMDMLRDPEETLLFATTSENPAIQQFAMRAYEKRMNALIAKVAERTNADPAQVRDPKTRTKEQQSLLFEISAEEQMQRMDLFFNSNFHQALNAVMPLEGKYHHPGEMVNDLIRQNAVFYYFVKNPDIKPIGPAQLTAKQLDEIKSLFFKLNNYCYKVTNGGELDLPETYFADFIEAEGGQLPHITAPTLEFVDYPIDKINRNVWDDLENVPKNEHGQIAFAMEKKGSQKEATILYSIDFEELEKQDGLKLTKQLSAFDKRVYIAACAVFTHSGPYMSPGQIFTAMGGKGEPTGTQKNKINDSLTKMRAANVLLDNTFETPVNKKYPQFRYDSSLLPFERVSAYINNTFVESAIHLFREPPLMTFAKERKQITTISRKLLETPLNQTEDNLRIEDYLIERIALMKNPKNKIPDKNKILFSTMYEKIKIDGKGEKNKKARQRTPEKIRACLDYFVEQGYIKSYVMDKESVTIDYKKDNK